MTRAPAFGAMILLASPALAHAQQGGYHGGWGDHMMWGGWGWIFGPLMMLFWIILLIAVVVLLVRWLGGTGGSSSAAPPPPPARPARDALDILRERFARGEIDEEEFERRRALLER